MSQPDDKIPDSVKIRVCPVCGRQGVRGKHYAVGALCPGQVVLVEYRRVET